MLIFLFFVYILGGSGGPANLGHFYRSQAKDYIKAEVKDPERKKDALAAAKKARKATEGFVKQTMKSGKKLTKLYKNYASTPEEFDELARNTLADQRDAVATIIEARQQMLKSITETEWAAIIADARREDEEEEKKAAEKAAEKAAKDAAKP